MRVSADGLRQLNLKDNNTQPSNKMNLIALIVVYGSLAVDEKDIHSAELREHFQAFHQKDRQPGVVLLRRYDGGDADTIRWPKPNEENLKSALFDAREMGLLPPFAEEVVLPDGTPFEID